MITTVDTLIENMRERIESLISRDSNYLVKENLRQKSRQRFGESHEDVSDINPFLIPLILIGTKYDIFQVTLSHPFTSMF
jgi:dynein light intermediate chain 2